MSLRAAQVGFGLLSRLRVQACATMASSQFHTIWLQGCWVDVGTVHPCEAFWVPTVHKGRWKDQAETAQDLTPPCLASAVPTTTLLVTLPLFTAVWWVPPLPAADCWSCLRSPVWRADCPTRQTGGLAQPGAIWMWAIWTCDKKQKPWWGGRPTSQTQNKTTQGRRTGRKKKAGHRKKLWWGKIWRNKF